MKILLSLLCVLILASGCGQKEVQQGNTPGMDQRRDMGRKLIVKSLSDLQNKDLKGCVESLELSIKVNPSEPEAYMLLGQVLIKVGEATRSVEFLDNAVKVFPNNGSLFYLLSTAYKWQGKKLPAVLAARRSTELFQQAQDKDNMLKSATLLQDLINTPDDAFDAKKPGADIDTGKEEAPIAK